VITKLIILAAGQGSRLRPLTEDCPKGLVPLHGKPLMEWQIASARAAGITEIAIVCGFQAEKMPFEDVHYFFNPHYASTNMVETLKCARSFWDGGFIASYSDIVFEPEMISRQMNSPHPISVTIDRQWKPYWEQRFENVLEDAETLKMNEEGKILEIGAKPGDISEIQGQYVGLSGFADSAIPELEKFLNDPECPLTPGSYMTDLLQQLISKGISVHSSGFDAGWLEIDSLPDLDLAKERSTPGGNGLLSIKR
jgi:L-glutamine-phosphate cytidylyltransferase